MRDRTVVAIAVVAIGLMVLFFGTSVAFAQGGGGSTRNTEGEPAWMLKGTMPYHRGEIAVAAVDDKIYVLTGSAPGTQANGFAQEYDSTTGTWRDLPLMPSIASHPGAAAVGGKIYVVGGFVANVHIGAVDRVFEFDPASESWRAVAPLSAPRGSPAVVALNGRIHAIAGRDYDMIMQTTHEVYDPTTDTWTLAAPIPEARDHTGVTVMDGKIHVFGGRAGATANRLGTHYVYDPEMDSWSEAAALPTPRSAGVSFTLDGRIVYAGGECKDRETRTTFDEVEAYDPGTDNWAALPNLPTGLHAGAAVVLDAVAYVIGGNHGCGGGGPSEEIMTFSF